MDGGKGGANRGRARPGRARLIGGLKLTGKIECARRQRGCLLFLERQGRRCEEQHVDSRSIKIAETGDRRRDAERDCVLVEPGDGLFRVTFFGRASGQSGKR